MAEGFPETDATEERKDDLENILTQPDFATADSDAAGEPTAELVPGPPVAEATVEPAPDVTVEPAPETQSAYDKIRARLGDERAASMDSYWNALHDDGTRHERKEHTGQPRTPEQQAAFEARVRKDIEQRGPDFTKDFRDYSTARTAAETPADPDADTTAEADTTPETDGEKIARLEAENTALREEREQNLARISQLEGQVAELNDRVARLEARLGIPSPDAPPVPTGNPALDAENGARARNGRERNGTNGAEMGPDTDLRRELWEKGTAAIDRAIEELRAAGVDVRRRNMVQARMQSMLEQTVGTANLAYVERTSERDVARGESADLRRQLDEERAARAAASPDTPSAATPEPGDVRPPIVSWPVVGAPTRVFPVTGDVAPPVPTGNPALDAEAAAATTTVLPAAAETEPVEPTGNPALDAETEPGANPALEAEAPLAMATRRRRAAQYFAERFGGRFNGTDGGATTPPTAAA